MRKGAERIRTTLARDSVVDRGAYKAAWEVVKLLNGYETTNTAPYAGVIERGIRPGAKFGRAAVDAIKGWVIRKGLVGRKPRKGSARLASYEAEAESIAWAIVKKL